MKQASDRSDLEVDVLKRNSRLTTKVERCLREQELQEERKRERHDDPTHLQEKSKVNL